MTLPTICGAAQTARLLACLEIIRHIDGEIWECGVYQGGSASRILEAVGYTRTIRLFDTFDGGIPIAGPLDNHRVGDFAITPEDGERLEQYFAPHDNVSLHRGFIPSTFAGLEDSRIALAHLDVDVFDTYQACLEFIYPRLTPGGFIVLDDYGAPSCPGATLAADAFVKARGLSLQMTDRWGATLQRPPAD